MLWSSTAALSDPQGGQPPFATDPCGVARASDLRAHARPARLLLSLLTAGALSGLILWSAGSSLTAPPLWLSALFLFFVVQQDVFHWRIPNLLTLPSLGIALTCVAVAGGVAGLTSGLLGSGLVFLVLFVPFAVGGMGAGDVKALMVLGALWGPQGAFGLVCWSLAFGGVIAFAVLAVRGGLADLCVRWIQSLGATFATGRWMYFRPPPKSVARSGLPFGVAMALAVAAMQLWGMPWGGM